MAYSFEMVLVGMILLSAMIAGGIALRIKRRRETGITGEAGIEYNGADRHTAAGADMAGQDAAPDVQDDNRTDGVARAAGGHTGAGADMHVPDANENGTADK